MVHVWVIALEQTNMNRQFEWLVFALPLQSASQIEWTDKFDQSIFIKSISICAEL